jgi:3,4-dehydroadipyl-CoA semialdehyde dehydrogenase
MVKDVVEAGIFPAGALSVVCGSSTGLVYALQAFNVVSFTGSAVLRGAHAAVDARLQ